MRIDGQSPAWHCFRAFVSVFLIRTLKKKTLRNGLKQYHGLQNTDESWEEVISFFGNSPRHGDLPNPHHPSPSVG